MWFEETGQEHREIIWNNFLKSNLSHVVDVDINSYGFKAVYEHKRKKEDKQRDTEAHCNPHCREN